MHVSDIDLRLTYQLSGPSHFCFNIEAAHAPGQKIAAEDLTITPRLNVRSYRHPGYGNRFFRLDAPAGPLELRYRATVELSPLRDPSGLEEVPISDVPDNVLRYVMPSRYCESDVMSRSAQQMFGKLEPGYARVKAVTEWVRDAITYLPGSSTSTTTAQEVFVARAGVCRDFAHLGITLCRALNIPARLVVGYVNFEEPPQDFHAIFEAWLGGRWVLFDPTGMAPVDRLVRIGTGRDAKDVAFATIFGPACMTLKEVTVKEYERKARRPALEPVPMPAPPRAAGQDKERASPGVSIATA